MFLLLAPMLAFMACTQAPAQTPTTPVPSLSSTVLGTVELSFDPANTRGKAKVSTRAALPDNAASFTASSFSDFAFTTTSTRYLSATFNVTNNSGADFDNLTLYAYNQAGSSLGGTAIKNLVNFGGGAITADAAAQSLLPTHAITQPTPTSLAVDAARADFQAFKPSEVSSLQTQALGLGVVLAADNILEYGFVARNASGGRSIPNGGAGTITISYRVPESSFTNSSNPYRFVANFVLSNESTSRVTRGLDDTTSAADTRAAALSAQTFLIGADGESSSSGSTFRTGNVLTSLNPICLVQGVGAPTCAKLTEIGTIQGTASSSSLVATAPTFEGVVVGDFQNSVGPPIVTKLNGFFVQDSDGDGNANSSDGIFVFAPTAPDLAVGDIVRVTGTVAEFNSATQISGTVTATKLGTTTQPAVTDISLPVANLSDLEKYEGMRVRFTNTLTVTEHFQLGRFGQVVLGADGASNQTGTDGRFDNFTAFNSPSVTGYSAYLAELAKRRIYLDDASAKQNPDPILFGRGGTALSASNTLRGGDTVDNLAGVLNEGCNASTCGTTDLNSLPVYRLQTDSAVNFTAVNARSSTAPAVGGSLQVSSFNVLNFFTELGVVNISRPVGCSNTITSRGATNAPEFTRQRDKIVQAIVGINADVFGLTEIENDADSSTSAINNLVNAINAVVGVGTYAAITSPNVGCDAIKVAFIYKPASVTPIGAAAAPATGFGTGSFDDPPTVNNGKTGRKPLAQTFRQNSSGAVFTGVMNHFKSKSSSAGGVNDADALDGQGLSNGTRTNNAKDLRDWLATNPTGTTDPDFLLFGDFNAYHKEDPLTTLETAGYSNLLPTTSYSYVFSGQWGSLDHALGNASMLTQVTAAEKWHINSDEPSVLDYNTEFKTPAQVTSLYAADAFRSSDHDPVVIGLNLTAPASPTVSLTGSSSTNTGVSYSLGITATPASSSTLTGLTVNWGDGSALENLAVSATSAAHTFSGAGNYTISVTATDANTLTANATKTVAVTLPSPTISVSGSSSATVNTTYSLTITAAAVSGSSITALSVNWGDGSAVDNLGVSATSATHTFSSAGNFTITATVTDANTQTASATQAVTVSAISCTGTGGLVISQVYGGGGATTGTPTFNKDFVELKNNSTSAISLAGRSLQYGSSANNYGASAANILALSGTVAPCGYYLVALGTAGTTGAVLTPTPDITSINLNMAAASGKVALVTTTTSLGCGATATPCTFPNANILDAVGYGPTTVSAEGTPTVVLTNILAALRNTNGCTDTNSNVLDFTIGTPNPRNTASPSASCP
jgi:predicted extracellular nuclease